MYKGALGLIPSDAFNQAKLRKAKREIARAITDDLTEDVVWLAQKNHISIAVLILKRKFGWSDKRIESFVKEFVKYLDAKIVTEDLIQNARDECGIEFDGESYYES